ncbi:uncharacterized protein BJ212DRAFT_1304726 [Suillus subaureus]|uniref:Uncharacterized protein n=1 Tax=Suillus subaureus TaxID=48587 RepID=A0A9P7DU94_9AGAM|nr:uncharacterized protein BJ212DRAFT_1304726 [Suillus subaureus]KAG1803063.1 hypothetical protein BJ212DRAFT_1304726 [Suillus subaureus]
MNAAGLPQEHMQWEYNLNFICTSNIAPPLEMLKGVVEQIESCQETGIWAYDCSCHNIILVIISVLALLGDNPMQSLMSKFFCCCCWVKGKDVTDMLEVGGVKKETVHGMLHGMVSNDAETQSISHQMLENALTLARQKENVDLQTSTGVKDTVLCFFLDKLEKYFWQDAVEHLSAINKATIEAHLSTLNVSGLSQVVVFVLYDMLETKILDAWAVLCVLVPLLWMPKIDNFDDYMVELNAAIKRFMDCTAHWTPQWFNKLKFHLILHIVDHIWRFGPTITFATEVHKSYNNIICGWYDLQKEQKRALSFGTKLCHQHTVFPQCWEVVICNGDPVALDSFMVFHVQDHFLVGKVAKILMRGQDFEGKADWVLLQCYKIGPLVQLYWMPSLSKTERYHLVTPEQIDCSVNAQHNCAANQCKLTSTRPVFLEWEHQVEDTQAVRHHDDHTEDLILNVAKMQDAKFILKFREAAPPLDTDSLVTIVCESELAAGPAIAQNHGNININFNSNCPLTTVPNSQSQAPAYHNHSANSPYSAAPVQPSAGQKCTCSSLYDENSDEKFDQSLTSQVPQSSATQLPAAVVPPSGSIQAAADMPLPTKMTSLMSFAALNMCLQLVEETTAKVATFSSKLAVVKGLIKTLWVVDDALKAQFMDMAKRALVKEDQTNFVNMYQDVLHDVEQHPDDLKITEQLKAKIHRATIIRAICNACNNAHNNAWRFSCTACQILVSVQDGPLCLTLEDFTVSWLNCFNPAVATILLSVTLLAQVVQICDFAMHNLKLLDLDRNNNDENDESGTPAPASHHSKKKVKADTAKPKFWKQFETHLHTQRDHYVQDKDGYQHYIAGLIAKDHAQFSKPNTTVSQGNNALGSSTNPHAPMTADHDLNSMLATMFDFSGRH